MNVTKIEDEKNDKLCVHVYRIESFQTIECSMSFPPSSSVMCYDLWSPISVFLYLSMVFKCIVLIKIVLNAGDRKPNLNSFKHIIPHRKSHSRKA